jgi:hypothetical protein
LLLLFTRQGANEDRLLFHGPDLLTPPGYQRTFYGFALVIPSVRLGSWHYKINIPPLLPFQPGMTQGIT